MSITITDPNLLAFLGELTKVADGEINKLVEVHDPSGQLIGRFQTDWPGKLPPGAKSPISDEELARRRQLYQDGKPLAEILDRLRREHP